MSNKESNTSWLHNCPTVCYLIGFFLGAILFKCLMGMMNGWLAALISILAFLLVGWVLRKLLCRAKAAPVAAAAPAKKPAAKKAPAKKPAAKKPAAKKAPAKKAPAKKAAAEKPPVLFTKRPAQVDDLKKISGVGPKLEKTCNEIGVYQYAQIANWKKADIAVVDDKLSFKGRIERDEWVKQAKALAKAAK